MKTLCKAHQKRVNRLNARQVELSKDKSTTLDKWVGKMAKLNDRILAFYLDIRHCPNCTH